MRKIKVLQFPIANAAGGITQYALQNWKYIDKSKFQFDFATMSKKLDFEEELVEQGCKVHYIKCYAEENKEGFIEQINSILDEGYDVIHLHTSYWKSFEVEKIAKLRNVPIVIVHSHSTMIDIEDTQKREKAILQHNLMRDQVDECLATYFCACSKLAGTWLYGNKIDPSKVILLNNAIDIQKYSYKNLIRKQYRKELGLEGKFVIGHVGRFVYQKNHEFIVKVFQKIYEQNENARLLLIGTGPNQDIIKKAICDNKLDRAVIFMGKRNDVENLLQVMDIFILPSRFEGLAISLIEAQASGIKCLTSEHVTREAKITNNITFLPDEVMTWVEAIKAVMMGYKREKQDKALQDAGYDIRLQIKNLERLYEGRVK